MKRQEYIMSFKTHCPYIIRNTKKNLKKSNQILVVNNKKEMEIFLFMLQDNVSIYEPDFESDNSWKWLRNLTYTDIRTIKMFPTDKNVILKCFSRISFFPESSMLSDTLIEKKLVHKNSKENVMISNPTHLPNSLLYSFKGLWKNSKEIILDHKHDKHVESLILYELCRESAIATINIQSNTAHQYAILEEKFQFTRFVDRNTDLFVRTVFFPHGKVLGICYFQIIQKNKNCVSGYFMGIDHNKKGEKNGKN